MIKYELIRSKRKTTAIHLTREAKVLVRAPLKAKTEDIESFLISKESLIIRHLDKITANIGRREEFVIDYCGTVRLCGKTFQIRESEGKYAGFDDDGFYVPPGLAPETIKGVLIRVYKQTAKKILNEKVKKYSEIMKLYPNDVKVNSAKTRWGSCSGRNSINFSWKLVLAEEEAVDYVVVHELAHIAEHNHSQRFWKLVGTIMPDYEQRKLLLKDEQARQADEDWNEK